MTKSIFWGNGGDDVVVGGCNLTVTHSDTEEAIDGEGNISDDPMFVDPASGDFSLDPASPAAGLGATGAVHGVDRLGTPATRDVRVTGVLGRAGRRDVSLSGFRPSPPARVPDLVAFPGAEGFGAGATGGRGGDVVIVDTLEPFGPGSLGEALAPEDCRPADRRVPGQRRHRGAWPNYDLELTCGDVTIAGPDRAGRRHHDQRPDRRLRRRPGGNIIIRHVRFRPPPITDEEGAVDDLGHQLRRAPAGRTTRNMMLDHLSLSWGSDETLDLYEFAPDSTVQWTTIEQSNPEGSPRGRTTTG